MDNGELQTMFEEMMERYAAIKSEVRKRNSHLFEQWKAGGFLVDDDILSMYPSLEKVMESLDLDSSDENEDE